MRLSKFGVDSEDEKASAIPNGSIHTRYIQGVSGNVVEASAMLVILA